MPTTTRRSKHPRHSYKSLWACEVHHRIECETRVKALQAKLRRMREALAPVGERVLTGAPLGDDPIRLNTHDFVCAEAFLDGNLRFTTDVLDSPLVGFQGFDWRGRPIVEDAEAAAVRADDSSLRARMEQYAQRLERCPHTLCSRSEEEAEDYAALILRRLLNQ